MSEERNLGLRVVHSFKMGPSGYRVVRRWETDSRPVYVVEQLSVDALGGDAWRETDVFRSASSDSNRQLVYELLEMAAGRWEREVKAEVRETQSRTCGTCRHHESMVARDRGRCTYEGGAHFDQVVISSEDCCDQWKEFGGVEDRGPYQKIMCVGCMKFFDNEDLSVCEDCDGWLCDDCIELGDDSTGYCSSCIDDHRRRRADDMMQFPLKPKHFQHAALIQTFVFLAYWRWHNARHDYSQQTLIDIMDRVKRDLNYPYETLVQVGEILGPDAPDTGMVKISLKLDALANVLRFNVDPRRHILECVTFITSDSDRAVPVNVFKTEYLVEVIVEDDESGEDG